MTRYCHKNNCENVANVMMTLKLLKNPYRAVTYTCRKHINVLLKKSEADDFQHYFVKMDLALEKKKAKKKAVKRK